MKEFRIKQQIIFFLFLIITLQLSQAAHAADIAIVVNKANPTNNVSFKALIKIFKRENQYWKDGRKIYLVLQEEGSHEKKIVLKKIYKMSATDLKKFWLARIFREEPSLFPRTFSSNKEVKQFVSQVPNAIGYIDATYVDESIKVLRINGKSLGEKGYILSEK